MYTAAQGDDCAFTATGDNLRAGAHVAYRACTAGRERLRTAIHAVGYTRLASCQIPLIAYRYHPDNACAAARDDLLRGNILDIARTAAAYLLLAH